ncbi:5-(carboxyamino)imidazole ribonucleotide synthase [Wolbachia endosymbiont of Folsomia candida]|uniref:5-(carboxyamino)imidazole ribonucleotide synthase n=1 Tax=Wolbachia endosymbiont of Folsomia candida TaxID=169402 RepID=UPI000A562A1A|nr:5-(carboxyamino)imidazole ribonucleotide synthase [Wolbachia endosymbiont of Folsomia candida]
MNEPSVLSQKVIGIIGSGQLGKMTAIAAAKLGQKIHIFANAKDDPACSLADNVIVADFSDKKALESFAKNVDLVTIESENIPCSVIDVIEQHKDFYPGKKALYISQNRLREKDFIRDVNIKTADYKSIQNYDELLKNCEFFGYSARLKTAEMGYDGKGQYVIKNRLPTEHSIITSSSSVIRVADTGIQKKEDEDIDSSVTHWNDKMGSWNDKMGKWNDTLPEVAFLDWSKQYILEKDVDLLKEISIVVARDMRGKVAFFPIAENHHVDGILDTSTVPAKIDNKLTQEVQQIAEKVANALDLIGILAIEFFVTKDNELLINELAPRPHNSCHWSLDSCNISQFEQLVRIICGFPMQEVVLRFPCMTKNIIGDDIYDSHKYLSDKKASLTVYGKKEVRDKRKMGHVNIDLS